MSEENEQNVIETMSVKANDRSKLRTVGKTAVISLFVIFIISCGLLTYMQFATFEQKQIGMSASDFIEKDNHQWRYTNNGLKVNLPETLISYEVEPIVQKDLKDSAYELESLYYEGTSQTFKLNLKLAGFYIPVAYKMMYTIEAGELAMAYDQIEIGRHEVRAIGPLKLLLKMLPVSSLFESIKIDLTDYGMSKSVFLEQVNPVGRILELTFRISETALQELFTVMKESTDPELMAIYKDSTAPAAVEAADLLTQIYPLSKDQITRVITDLTGDQELIRHMLVLTNEEVTNDIIDSLIEEGINIDKEQIALDRKALEGQVIDDYAVLIFQGLGDYFEDKIIAYNMGRPFDLERMKTITVSEIVRKYQIEIDQEMLDRMSFVLEDGFNIAYEVDPSTYYIKSLNDFRVVSKEEFEKIPGSAPYIVPRLVVDADQWSEVLATLQTYFEVERIFIRYMKTDGSSVFVVASPDDDPQNYWSFALLKKDDEYKILEDNVQSMEGLLEAHPDFNVETATREIETVTLKRLSSDILDLILDEMKQQGKLSSRGDYSIEFSSYDGKYISFLISNGDAYVYKVEGTSFGTYLATVYPKEKAMRNWPDLPKLILLQDDPTEVQQ